MQMQHLNFPGTDMPFGKYELSQENPVQTNFQLIEQSMLKDLMRNTVRAGKQLQKALMEYLEPKSAKKSKTLTVVRKPTFQPKIDNF